MNIVFLLLFVLTHAELHSYGFSGLRDVKYRHFLEASRPVGHAANVRAEQEGRRVKRSPLFSTGVKVCPQDTVKAVIGSHRAFYKLRGTFGSNRFSRFSAAFVQFYIELHLPRHWKVLEMDDRCSFERLKSVCLGQKGLLSTWSTQQAIFKQGRLNWRIGGNSVAPVMALSGNLNFPQASGYWTMRHLFHPRRQMERAVLFAFIILIFRENKWP